MQTQEDKYTTIEKIIEMFYNVGCDFQSAKSFITNNTKLINETPDIEQKLYFILNNTEVYGVILVIDNDYQWSIYKDFEFKPFETIKDEETETLTNGDYIVEMMINFANQEKVISIIPDIQEYNLEQQIKTLKSIGLNSNGYHFK